MKNPKTANETQHKRAIQNPIMYAQCSALSAPGPMCAMKYALSHYYKKNWVRQTNKRLQFVTQLKNIKRNKKELITTGIPGN